MILPRDAVIAGHPVQEVKKAFRELGGGFMRHTKSTYLNLVQRRVTRSDWLDDEELAQALSKAGKLWDALVQEGYLVLDDEWPGHEQYRLSDEALSIKQATLGKGYRRKSATKAVEGFLERCHALDAPDSIYPYRVALAVAFGSYCRGADPVGDVDIFLRLERKPGVLDDPRGRYHVFYEHMEAQDRSIPYWDYSWPWTQTHVFLKARSPILSFISDDDKHLAMALRGPHEVVYGTLPDPLPAEVIEALQ